MIFLKDGSRVALGTSRMGSRVKARGPDQKLGSEVTTIESFSLPTRPEPSCMRILSSWSPQVMPLGKDEKPQFPASGPIPQSHATEVNRYPIKGRNHS